MSPAKRIARLMRAQQLSGLVRRRKGKTTIRVPGIATAPDLVRREWNPTAPDRLWVADITFIRTWEGWLYLAAVLDWAIRAAVWAGRSPTTFAPTWCSTRSRWRSPGAGRSPASCITQTRDRNTSHLPSASA